MSWSGLQVSGEKSIETPGFNGSHAGDKITDKATQTCILKKMVKSPGANPPVWSLRGMPEQKLGFENGLHEDRFHVFGEFLKFDFFQNVLYCVPSDMACLVFLHAPFCFGVIQWVTDHGPYGVMMAQCFPLMGLRGPEVGDGEVEF